MQRYLASDLPQGDGRQPQQNGRGSYENPAAHAVHHATQLGYYIVEQRGREGAIQYMEGLLCVLPSQMVEQICQSLRIPVPQKKSVPVSDETEMKTPQRRTRSEPDMEMVLKLMQLMKGDGKQDLSAMLKLMSGRKD